MKYKIILILLLTLPGFAGEWNKVYLATFPRSGNHWMRYLIEEASHIATSSVYKDKDPPHLEKIFPWEGFCADHGYEGSCRYPKPGETVVIKTHFPYFLHRELDDLTSIKTIRIIRHPLDSFYSFYRYRHSNLSSRAKIPEQTLQEFILAWREFQEFWDRQPNVLTIRYEDLYTDPHTAFTKVMQVIDYPLQEEDLLRALAKYPPQGGLLKHLHHFDEKALGMAEQQLGDLLRRYGYGITQINPHEPDANN